METQLERPPIALLLESLRLKAKMSKQALAIASKVSATYVRTIEAGFDDVGRPVLPSPGVIRQLATGLSSTEEFEGARLEKVQQVFTELMKAAGHLSSVPDEMPVTAATNLLGEDAVPAYAESTSLTLPVSVILRDPRLLKHVYGLLENWESLNEEDQSLLLGIMELIDLRRRGTNTHL